MLDESKLKEVNICRIKKKNYIVVKSESGVESYITTNTIECANKCIVNFKANETMGVYLTRTNSIFKKKLMLNGLGYKYTLADQKLTFKLGYSHLKTILIPQYILKVSSKTKRRKTKITMESYDKVLLGNFAESIYRLRCYDVYKAKGFSYIGKSKVRKEVRKK
jgi:large subunit ribosomal protein L6